MKNIILFILIIQTLLKIAYQKDIVIESIKDFTENNKNKNSFTQITLKDFGNKNNQSYSPFLKFFNKKIGMFQLMLNSETRSFQIQNAKNVLLEQLQDNKMILTPTKNVSVKNLLITNDIIYQNKKQWKLILSEQFDVNQETIGWTDNSVTQCQGVNMLGGYGKFAGGEVIKTYNNLPQHKKIKIEAKFHFIDTWVGETGFMRADIHQDNTMQYLWTQKYDSAQILNGINLCGNETPEGKFQDNISVYIPHAQNSIKISFGSTLGDDPLHSSFGISSIQLYIQ